MEKIILASKSPRRKQLLELAEIDFDVVSIDTDESYPETLAIEEIPKYIALQKAMAVKEKLANDRIILAADTIVTIDNKIIGKPVDREDAVNILKNLSGKIHKVISGVAIVQQNKKVIFNEITEVYFYELADAQIVHYIDKYRPFDKAGAYAIQEWIGAVGINSIKGDYYNVVGLPVSKVVKELQQFLQDSYSTKTNLSTKKEIE